MRDAASSTLADREVLGMQIREEIATSKHLHDDVYVVLVLKHIVEFNYVWMLTDFQHFNLSFQ